MYGVMRSVVAGGIVVIVVVSVVGLVPNEVFRSNCWHCGPHAKSSCFIRSGADDRPVAAPSDNDGFASQLRIIPLFHRRIKRVHVDVHDFAYRHVGPILFLSPGQVRARLSSISCPADSRT